MEEQDTPFETQFPIEAWKREFDKLEAWKAGKPLHGEVPEMDAVQRASEILRDWYKMACSEPSVTPSGDGGIILRWINKEVCLWMY